MNEGKTIREALGEPGDWLSCDGEECGDQEMADLTERALAELAALERQLKDAKDLTEVLWEIKVMCDSWIESDFQAGLDSRRAELVRALAERARARWEQGAQP